MHPLTTRRINAKEFADIKHTVAIRSRARRSLLADPGYAAPLPQEVSLQLTYRCNLRCTHCYQWNEQGFFRDFSPARQKTELDVEIIESVLRTTAPTRSKLFLWGGEPLMHTKFGQVAELLERYPRTVNMCTNGLLFKRKLDDMLRIGENLNLLVSLDGLGEDHEALRGKGTFKRTMDNIQMMLDLKRSGQFDGEISLSCMVSHVTVGKMYEFMEWAEELGVNTVYFQFPWYISPEVAAQMDEVYEKSFSWLEPDTGTKQPTWHSYTYRPAQRRSKCLAVSNRMEVHADGNVSSCKFFPEFVVGNLYDTEVTELWQSEAFRQVRSILSANGMMPVCSKCILLYLNGV
jgi:radical SAM protein with 4Fe4S-binding SPASM domain